MTAIVTLTAVVAYIVFLFALARFSRSKGGITTKKHPRWVVTLAMVGACVTGITFISIPGSVATDALSYLQMNIGFVIAYVIIAYWLIPIYYRYNVTSLYEYLDKRFGANSNITGATFFLVSKILSAALRLFIVCIVLQQLLCDALGVPLWLTATIFMAISWYYTHRGGLSSILWADIVKIICVAACIVVSAIFVLHSLDISFVEAMRQGSEQGLTRIFFFDDINNDRHFLKLLFSGILLVVATTGLDQDLMQRILSSDSLRSAQRSMVLSSLLQVAVITMLLLLGVTLYLYLGENNISGVRADNVFAFVAMREEMPMVLSVLLVLGVISATFSSIGGSLTAIATSFMIDVVKARKRFDEKLFNRVYRIVLFMAAIAMILAVFAFDKWSNTSSINVFFIMSSYTFGPILGMFLFGAASKRQVYDRLVPVVAIISPLICALLDYYSERWFWGYSFGFEIVLINALFTIVGLLIISRKRV